MTAIYEDGALITEYLYDTLGRQVKATNANGVVQTTAYNLAGRGKHLVGRGLAPAAQQASD